MAWCQTSNKPLPELILSLLTDAYMWHQGEMSKSCMKWIYIFFLNYLDIFPSFWLLSQSKSVDIVRQKVTDHLLQEFLLFVIACQSNVLHELEEVACTLGLVWSAPGNAISQKVYESQSCKNPNFFFLRNNNAIKPKYCTCNDSWAVVTCASFWPDYMIKISTNYRDVYQDFNYEVIDPL